MLEEEEEEDTHDDDDDDDDVRLLELQAKAYRLKQKLAKASAITTSTAAAQQQQQPADEQQHRSLKPIVSSDLDDEDATDSTAVVRPPQAGKLRKFLAKHV